MNSKVENSKSAMTDTLLLLVALIMLLGGIGAYYFYQDYAIWARVIGLIAVVLGAGWVASRSKQGATLFRFLKEADIERRKVVWPTHQETVQTSIMVIIVVVIISLFLASVDWMIGALVRALLSGGG